MKPLNLLALLLFLAGLGWALTRSERAVREIQATYYRAISPFLSGGSELELQARRFLQEVESSKRLEAEVEAMRDDLARLRLIESELRKLEAENARLRKALGFVESDRFELVAAQVSRRNTDRWWETIEIDQGQRAGIAAADTVVTEQGLVGKVDRAGPERSKVLLLTDEACQVSAKVEGTPEVGILQGQREQFGETPRLRLRFLSRDARLRPGMRVLSTGRGGLFPADLMLGKIDQVLPGPLVSEAMVGPSVDFGDLGTVFVLTSRKQGS
jgi:rod shape-determining protein MreC